MKPKFETLPNELLISIAGYLSQYDLHSLALTCKKLTSTAESVLYRAPVMGKLYTEHQDPLYTKKCLLTFTQTLLRFPRLASRVRSLSLTVSRGGLEAPFDPEIIRRVERVLREVGQHSSQWASRIEDWKNQLEVGHGVTWTGLLLTIVPKLRTLTIEILSDYGLQIASTYQGELRYDHELLERLFGYIGENFDAAALSPLNLTAISGLRHLQILRYFCYDMASSWIYLPALEYLEIG